MVLTVYKIKYTAQYKSGREELSSGSVMEWVENWLARAFRQEHVTVHTK